MANGGTLLKIFCNSCGRYTNHSVKGTYTHPPGQPERAPYPIDQAQILRRRVERFFEASQQWPNPEAGWEWLLSSEERSPEDDVQGAVEDLDDWLNDDPQLEQELWHEEMLTCTLLRQGWRWIDVLRACHLGLEQQERWEIVKCVGCETPSLRICRWSEDNDILDPVTGRLLSREETPEFFPARTNELGPNWVLPEWVSYTPPGMQRLLTQSYDALNEGLLAVGSMGIRSAVELVMIERVGDEGNFKQKLQRLFDQELITKEELSTLDAVIEFGHATVHRQHIPTAEDVRTLTNLFELLLYRLYEMPRQTRELRRRTPPRRYPKPKPI